MRHRNRIQIQKVIQIRKFNCISRRKYFVLQLFYISIHYNIYVDVVENIPNNYVNMHRNLKAINPIS